jgi:integrase
MKYYMKLFKEKRYGYWYISFGRGTVKSLKTKDRNQAETLYNQIKRQWLKGNLVKLDKVQRISLGDFTTAYLESRQDLDPDTLRADELALRLLGDAVGGPGVAVRAINIRKIEHFKLTCMARNLSPVSINTYLRHIRAAYNTAYEWGYLEKPLKVKQVKVGLRHPVILSHDERLKLLRYARRHDIEMYRIIVFALWTGARREEILFIRWQNRTGKKLKVIGKGDKERTLPILPMASYAMGHPKDVGPVFKQWHKDTISKKFKAICRACGLSESITFHKLRHSSATQMLSSEIPLEVVQQILGHVDIRTTQIYAQVLDELVVNQMEKLKY